MAELSSPNRQSYKGQPMATHKRKRIVEFYPYYPNKISIRVKDVSPIPKSGYFVLRKATDDSGHYDMKVALLTVTATHDLEVTFKTNDYKKGEAANIDYFKIHFE